MKFKKSLLSLVAFSFLLVAGCGQISSDSVSQEDSEPASSDIISTSTTSSEDVSSSIDYGTLTIGDIEVSFMNEIIINPIFSNVEYEEDLSYEFEGTNISIIDGKVKGLIPETETTVTAKGLIFETTFKVVVNYLEATLTNDTGAESKFAVPLPEASITNYLLHLTVDVPTYISDFTRVSSFAFNGSDNSWYSMEMGADGRVMLYGHFNGIEKYHIFIGNREEMLVEGVLHYQVELLKQGQATYFYVNDKLVCGFSEEEMIGYATLSSFEVTAAADRTNAGKYVVELSKVYWELEGSENYNKYGQATSLSFPDMVLAKEDGSEAKYAYGDISMLYSNFVYSTTIDIQTWDVNKTRPCAFAFNGSDNSWYNIEMNNEGALTLYARFNGVEKYHIYLANKNDLMVEDAIHFTINILKEDQATWFFFNDKLVCWYTEQELMGYGKLGLFEVTAATDVWQDGGAYSVAFSSTSIEMDETANYDKYMDKVYKNYPDATLSSPTGAEQKAPEVVVTDSMIYSCTVEVVLDSTGWFRPTAFAFNNSDNSWYNIETDTSGNLTLYAKFNGVEKYGIALGTKADCTVEGVITYDIVILKKGQSTYFFFNDVLKASFSNEEMLGYAGLFSLNITSCADRAASAFEVQLKNQKVQNALSADFATYDALTVAI
ncbi:MAG: hypothetical protein WCR35_01595 [Bacilli bacterium]